MSYIKFGFIGTGNMGSALARAVCKAVGNDEVSVCDKFSQKAEALANELGCTASDIKSVATNCKYIFLGVKPQVLPEMLKSISDILKNRTDRFILVTMAAGIKMAEISNILSKEYPIIRIMPNTPVSVGKGMVLYTANDSVFMNEIGEFANAMSFAGKIDRLDEKLIDAGCALSGSGPAFVYMFAESLADAAVKCGLPMDKAILYASQTLAGSAELLLTSGKHPAVLKDEVCSPAGTTIEGVKALEDGGFRAAVMSAVTSAYDRAKNLGK